MCEDRNLIEDHSKILFVLDSQNYPAGTLIEFEREKLPPSVALKEIEDNNFKEPEKIDYAYNFDFVEALKRGVVNCRNGSKRVDKRMSLMNLDSIKEVIKTVYDGEYDHKTNSFTIKEKEFKRLISRLDVSIFGLWDIKSQFNVIKENGEQKEYNYDDLVNPLFSPFHLEGGRLVPGSKLEKSPYGMFIFDGIINLGYAKNNGNLTEEDINLLDSSFINIDRHLAGSQKAKFYLRIKSYGFKQPPRIKIKFEESKETGDLAIKSDDLLEQLNNHQDDIQEIFIWADENQEFIGQTGIRTLVNCLESEGYNVNLLDEKIEVF
jgi:hypothetical protein